MFTRHAARRFAGSAAKESLHKCIELDSTGMVRVGHMSVKRLRETTGAHLRDLLQLGVTAREVAPGAREVAPPCVLPRDRATLVHFGGLKGVIGTHKALFFDAELLPVRRSLRRIAAGIRSSPRAEEDEYGEDQYEPDEALPFELVVLEGVLGEAASSYQRRCRLYEPVVKASIKKTTISSDEGFIEDLHRLSAFDGALARFENETKTAMLVLVDLLASDEDMLGLLVSETSQDPARHAVVELMLESYHRRLNVVAANIADLRAQLAAAQDLARVAIDLRRNKIIRFNIYLSISGIALSTTTAFAGIFGMNLLSGVEETPGVFALVSAVSLVSGVAVAGLFAAALDVWYARVDLTSAADDRVALAALLSNISSVEHAFYTHKANIHNLPGQTQNLPPTRADIAKLLRAGSGREPSDRELDLLFEIFDNPGHHMATLEEHDPITTTSTTPVDFGVPSSATDDSPGQKAGDRRAPQ